MKWSRKLIKMEDERRWMVSSCAIQTLSHVNISRKVLLCKMEKEKLSGCAIITTSETDALACKRLSNDFNFKNEVSRLEEISARRRTTIGWSVLHFYERECVATVSNKAALISDAWIASGRECCTYMRTECTRKSLKNLIRNGIDFDVRSARKKCIKRRKKNVNVGKEAKKKAALSGGLSIRLEANVYVGAWALRRHKSEGDAPSAGNFAL